MEPEDLKNSEELNRLVNDESELVNETTEEVKKDESVENRVADLENTVLETVNIVEEIADDAVPDNDADELAIEETIVETIEPDAVADEFTETVNEIVEAAFEEPLQTATEVIAETAEVAQAEEVPETAEETVAQEPLIAEMESDVPVENEPETVAEVVEESVEVAQKEAVSEITEEILESETAETEEPEIAEEASTVEAETPTEPVVEEKVQEEVESVVAAQKPETVEETETVEEIGSEDDEIADSENEEEEEETPDFNQYSQIELVNSLRNIVENGEGKERYINLIVAAFNQKAKEIAVEEKKKFLADGGAIEDYVPIEDPYRGDIDELIKKHRQAKFEQARKFEAEKEENLQKKYTIIEEIKNLLNTEESINRTFQEFRELQKKWYDIGPVPQAKMKDLWDTYHFHVENFYDYIKINKELRDLDLKKNLEAKISLCEKAEELLLEPSVIRAFNTLQKYHEQWREIGPVPRDKKDEIWERFRSVTLQINQKHQEFFDKRKVEQKRNYEAKIALCEKVEEIGSMKLETHREWDEKSKELIELQKVWRTIGFAPKRENNKIYDRFRKACDQFFNKRRDFYSQNKDTQNKNLQMKMDLCLEAEALMESTDWKNATQQFIEIQKRWREIGPVSRKQSDAIWKRFRAACDYFFERKSGHFSEIDEGQSDNLRKKHELIAEVENYVPDADVSESLKALRDFQRRWTEIGHVPIKEKDAVQNRFRNAINKHFDTLKLDNEKRDSLKFRSKIASLTENQKGLSKVRQEREKYMTKLKQLESDLGTLENNIGFFANSKNAQALIADLNLKIEDTKEKISALKDKIRIIDDLDKSEY